MNSEFSKVSIIGGGQIGASIAMALRQSDSDIEIVVVDKEGIKNGATASVFYEALAIKNIDKQNITFTYDPANIAGSGLVVLATPISAFGKVIENIAPYFSQDAIVTDIGSVKKIAIERIQKAAEGMRDQLPHGLSYVPGHIFNGNPGSGPLTSDPKLFDGQPMFLVPGVASQTAFDSVSHFFQSLGAKIRPISAAQHDQVVGTMSHLQHVLMFSLIQTETFPLGPYMFASDIGGWIHDRSRGMTRVANSGTEMWRAIFEDNRDNILESARHFQRILVEVADAMTPQSPPSRLEKILRLSRPNPPPISEIVESAHAYAKEIRGNRGGTKVPPNQYIGIKRLHESAFAALVSVAVARNLQRIESETGIKLADIANPSLKDGLGPIGIDPDATKELLVQYGPHLGKMARNYIRQMNILVEAIRKNDNQTINLYVDASRKIRQDILSGDTPRQADRSLRSDPLMGPLMPKVLVIDATGQPRQAFAL